jgi:AcrR family transcriptional regulator
VVTPDPRGRAEVKALRADARDNRARILRAADEVFGAGGAAASTEDVARLAGVGIATVFRHFPTKYDLLAAVLTERLERLAARARELLAAADAGAAFLGFFTDVVEGASTKVTIAEALFDAGAAPDDVPEAIARAGDELQTAFADLLARAQSAGAVRADVESPEVYALMVGTSRAVVHTHLPSSVEHRLVALALDALRPPPRP